MLHPGQPDKLRASGAGGHPFHLEIWTWEWSYFLFSKKQTSYSITYMWNLKKKNTHELICRTEIDSQTLRTLWLPMGTGGQEGWAGGWGLAGAHWGIWSDGSMGTCCIMQGTPPHSLSSSMWAKTARDWMHVCIKLNHIGGQPKWSHTLNQLDFHKALKKWKKQNKKKP